MRSAHRQRGLTLLEIAFAMIIFAGIVSAAIYGARVIKSSKVKAFIIQTTQIRNASESFRQRYGTWPGDFAQARTRLRDCNTVTRCNNGDGNDIVTNSDNSAACQLPDYTTAGQDFPCTDINNGNETAQFWRHLVVAGMLDGIKLRSATYKWGDGLPKVRMGGGFQIIYNSNRSNLYLRNFATNVSATGHYLSYQRLPTMLHHSFETTGDGPIASWDTRAIDLEIDDGQPLSGDMRSTGDWGCGNVLEPTTQNFYENTEQMQCFLLIKILP